LAHRFQHGLLLEMADQGVVDQRLLIAATGPFGLAAKVVQYCIVETDAGLGLAGLQGDDSALLR
jgi:hypothetical protein